MALRSSLIVANRRFGAVLLYISFLANIILIWERLRSAGNSEEGYQSLGLGKTLYQHTASSFAPKASDDQCIQSFGNGTCTDNFPAFHTLRLTHVVIPFHTSHVGKVESNIRSWQYFPPCSRDLGYGPQPNAPYHLVLYSSADSRKRQYILELEGRIQSLLGNLTLDILNCFQSIEIQHANLSGPSDTYYRGTRLMIEKLIVGKVKMQFPPQYIFYMEPDCIPIRANWLSAIDNSVRWPHAPLWMKGSIYRGHNKGVYATRHPPQLYHMNGNALYNIGDRQFRNFYLKHYKPYIQTVSRTRERSYDTDFYRFLYDPDNVMTARLVFHKFQYTEVVQNFWKSSFSMSKLRNDYPGTYLIHGGYPKP